MMKRQPVVRLAGVLALLSALMLACNLPLPAAEALTGVLEPATATVAVQTIQALLTPVVSPGAEEEPCGFQWATQPLPEVTQALQQYFNEAGQTNLKVTAEAFGENCVRADGSVARFLTMYTDIRVSLPVAQLQDEALLAGQLETVLRLVLDYPAEKLPGSLEGYLGLTFIDPQGNVENLWFKRLEGKAALDRGLSGAELLAELRPN